MLHKTDLIEAVATACDMKKGAATEVVDAVLQSITEGLNAHGEVSLSGFGKFAITERSARKGRNPKTGEAMDIPARKSVKFSPSKRLKDAVADAA